MSRAVDERHVAEEIARLITQQVPGTVPGEVADSLALGAEGLGLDSVAIVELVLACESRFDVTLPAELFDGHPLTVGLLINQVQRTLAAHADQPAEEASA